MSGRRRKAAKAGPTSGFDPAAFGRGMATIVRDHVQRQVAPLEKRLAALETRLADLEANR